jgi:hypothetical protein
MRIYIDEKWAMDDENEVGDDIDDDENGFA